MVWKFISFLVIIILFGPEWSGKTWNALPDIYLVAARTSPIVKKKKKKKKERMESWRLSFVDTRNGHGLRGTLRDRSHAQEAAVLLSKTGIYSLMPARKKRKRVDDEGARLPKT